jgi:glycosidase
MLIGEVAFSGIRRDHLPTLNLPEKERYFLAQERNIDVLDATMKEYVEVFDGLLDFHFQSVLKTQIAWPRGKVRPARARELLDRHYSQYPRECSLLSFLDNHDQPRFLFEAGGRRDRLLTAARLQFEQPQPPVIYYGTEIGMSQNGPFAGHFSDLKCRTMMRWDERDPELLSQYQSLIAQWKRVFASGLEDRAKA